MLPYSVLGDYCSPIYHPSLSMYTYAHCTGGYLTDDYGNSIKILFRHNMQFQSYIAQRT